jgi:hypothetical protein
VVYGPPKRERDDLRQVMQPSDEQFTTVASGCRILFRAPKFLITFGAFGNRRASVSADISNAGIGRRVVSQCSQFVSMRRGKVGIPRTLSRLGRPLQRALNILGSARPTLGWV